MDKNQFRIQVYHNRYTRGVVVTICRIILWTLLYALFTGLTVAIFANDLEIANSTLAALIDGGAIPTGAIVATLIVVVLTIVYYTAVIWEIILKIRQNKRITAAENEYFKEGKKA